MLSRKEPLILTDESVFPDSKYEKPTSYEERPTVKVIVENTFGEIVLLTTRDHGIFLLPGGGADSKDLRMEAERECEEEINSNIKIKEVVSSSEEFRNKHGKLYKTTCFSAVAISETLPDARTVSEKENNLRYEWFSKEEVLEIMKAQLSKLKRGEVEFCNLGFNIVRDLFFVEEYLSKK